MPNDDPDLRTSPRLCGACAHGANAHRERGCTAFLPGTALAPPRACPCARDRVAALHAAPKKTRHLTAVE